MLKKVNEQVEGQIKKIVEEGLQLNNIDRLYKLVDIHKDIANEEYWKKKEEVMENEVRKLQRKRKL